MTISHAQARIILKRLPWPKKWRPHRVVFGESADGFVCRLNRGDFVAHACAPSTEWALRAAIETYAMHLEVVSVNARVAISVEADRLLAN